MKLQTIRLSNFQSFGAVPTEIRLEEISYLIGPNGSGKTAALQALCRLFAFDPSLRRILRSDFHVPFNEAAPPAERQLWIEADLLFPELDDDEDNSSVAPHFSHMRLDEIDGTPRVRFRLTATMGLDGDIEESMVYVLDINADGSPLTTAQVPRSERNHIHVHYLPARRDPADHIAYGANALLGRMLRAVNWDAERTVIKGLTDQISGSLAANPSINAFSTSLKSAWSALHKGSFFADPKLTFVASEIEALLRHMSVSFTPGHDEQLVDFSRLSDGQKSMLYLSLVLSSQAIGRAVLAEEDDSFDADKLRPPVFTVVAVEEPENSLSPHYLGRIVNALNAITSDGDAQALIATHAPSMLRRVAPEHIRYLRLTLERTSSVAHIQLPEATDEAHKFVREAVQAFPEIFFSRLVVLGEGDSEEIVLPRLLQVKGAPIDESAVTIAPLGGRHVNHFWRLLSALQIPYLTLLDLDVARYAAGWGRIKYVNDQLAVYQQGKVLPADHVIPNWKDATHKVRDYDNYLEALEERDVYFSYPMDLDFTMLLSFPEAYGVEEDEPDEATIKAVLGKKHHDASQYSKDEQKLFNTYHQRFKLGSKPAAHIDALAQLPDEGLLADMPACLDRLADAVIAKLGGVARVIAVDAWTPADGLTLEPNALLAAREQVRSLALTAGPGAGKTEMLAQRADFLLRTGTCRYPKRILAISFKVDASSNLKERVKRRCGSELAVRFDSYTFHAFAKRIIDRFRPVLTGQDALDAGYKIGSPRVTNKQVGFDDLVPLAIQILQKSKVARNAIRQTYSDVFLDEFQDCTNLQYELLKLAFQRTGIRLTAVGDTKQKIMGWAGAMNGIFQTFVVDFAATPLNMYRNFRSKPRLLSLQNEIIRRLDPASVMPDEQLSGDEGEVFAWRFEDSRKEADYLADLIEGWIKIEQQAPAEIAVLIRNQLDLYADHLMEALETRGIPFRNEQQMQDITVEPAARLIVDYLSCLYGQREPKAWIRLMNQLIPFADEEIQSNARKDLDRLVKQQRKEIAFAELVHEPFSGWWEYVRAFLNQVSIETLVSLSPDYESHDRLKEVIREIKARIEELLKLETDLLKALQRFSDDQAVRILTIHKSKGLEFDSVIIMAVENEIFFGDQDENRCAYFVGVSRAKRRLVLTHADQRERPAGHTRRWDVQRTAQTEYFGYATPFVRQEQ